MEGPTFASGACGSSAEWPRPARLHGDGRPLGEWLPGEGPVVVGRDSRVASGEMAAAAVTSGLVGVGRATSWSWASSPRRPWRSRVRELRAAGGIQISAPQPCRLERTGSCSPGAGSSSPPRRALAFRARLTPGGRSSEPGTGLGTIERRDDSPRSTSSASSPRRSWMGGNPGSRVPRRRGLRRLAPAGRSPGSCSNGFVRSGVRRFRAHGRFPRDPEPDRRTRWGARRRGPTQRGVGRFRARPRRDRWRSWTSVGGPSGRSRLPWW